MNNELINLKKEEIKSTGYVVDTLEASLWCLFNTKSYEEAVLTAVNLGGDSDTIAAITGSLAGLYYGLESIPEKWIMKILEKEKIDKIIDRFIENVKTPIDKLDNIFDKKNDETPNDLSQEDEYLEMDIKDWNNLEDEKIEKFLNNYLGIDIAEDDEKFLKTLDYIVHILAAFTNLKLIELARFLFTIPTINELDGIKKILNYKSSISEILAEIKNSEQKAIMTFEGIYRRAADYNDNYWHDKDGKISVSLPNDYNNYDSIEKKKFIVDNILSLRQMEMCAVNLVKIRLDDRDKNLTKTYKDSISNPYESVSKRLRWPDFDIQKTDPKLFEILDKFFKQNSE